MKRRELNIGNIVQVGFNKVRVVRDEKVSCDACYFRPICFKDYDTLKWKQEKFGFDYFKKQIEQDEDFAYLQDETYYLDEDLDELAYDIAYEIALKLKENDFFHQCEQCMLETYRIE